MNIDNLYGQSDTLIQIKLTEYHDIEESREQKYIKQSPCIYRSSYPINTIMCIVGT